MIAAILRVRRRAPEGGYFNDGDRASGVFGVLATGFALLLGFVDLPRVHQVRRVPGGCRGRGAGGCPALRDRPADALGRQRPARRRGRVLRALGGEPRVAGDGGGAWVRDDQSVGALDVPHAPNGRAGPPPSRARTTPGSSQTNAREEARRDRLHAAEGIVPLPMWIVLLLSAALVLVYLLFFADSGERAVVQGLLAGSVTAVIVASLARPVVAEPTLRPRRRRDQARRDAAVPSDHRIRSRCARPR